MHFALWALMKSPLMVGHDLRSINDSSLELLLKKVGGGDACECVHLRPGLVAGRGRVRLEAAWGWAVCASAGWRL